MLRRVRLEQTQFHLRRERARVELAEQRGRPRLKRRVRARADQDGVDDLRRREQVDAERGERRLEERDARQDVGDVGAAAQQRHRLLADAVAGTAYTTGVDSAAAAAASASAIDAYTSSKFDDVSYSASNVENSRQRRRRVLRRARKTPAGLLERGPRAARDRGGRAGAEADDGDAAAQRS